MTPVLEGRDLRLSRGGRKLLDGVSFQLRRSEAVVIQGPSGSGKTTLARVLATLLQPDSGSLLLDGQDADGIEPTRFRTRVAYIAQQPAMFPGTVAQNVMAGPGLHRKTLAAERPQELLASVGLEASFLSHEARTLSGGEKQRVALARALANQPDVLLLDEPTAALDPEAAVQIVSLLRSLAAGGLSLVMVTHEQEQASALGGVRYRYEGGRLEPEA
jgi:putative ABC transport system ATP-binding protein